MIDALFILCGSMLAVMLLALALDAAKRKNPWREFAGDAAISLAVVAGFGWLLHWIVSWMLDTGLIVAFAIIAFGFLCLWLLIGALGAVAGLVNPRD